MVRTFEVGGVIRARTTAQLTSRIVAEVREVRVAAGDRVKRGQIVVVLDDRDPATRRAQADASLIAARSGAASADAHRDAAEAALTLARVQHTRIQQLGDSKSATQAELDRATAELRMAEGNAGAAQARSAEAVASVAAAEAAARTAAVSLSYSTIAAPFDGLVTIRHSEPGNMASPGLPLVTIEALDGFRLEFQTDENRARALRTGDEVAVERDKGEGRAAMTGRIIEIAPAIDPVSRAFTVKVAIPQDASVRSGMFARARVRTGVDDTLVVPADAVVRRGQLAFVFVVEAGGHARMRAVRLGRRADDAVEILAGVAAGETVVIAPPSRLIDGTAVRVAGAKP
jgi:RND family efflux transporter MFP subunit